MTTRYTPVYNIPVPGSDDKPKDFSDQIWSLGLGVEAALAAASIPGTSNPDIRVSSSAAARDSYFGTPATEAARLALQARAATALRTDTGVMERYYATYNATTNPQGRYAPGWYPTGPITAQYTGGFTSSGTAPNPIGALTLDAANSSPMAASVFGTGTSQLIMRNAGIYQFGASLRMTSGLFGSRAFIDFSYPALLRRIPWSATDEDSVTGSLQAFYLPAGTIVGISVYRNTSSSNPVTFVINATYLGPR